MEHQPTPENLYFSNDDNTHAKTIIKYAKHSFINNTSHDCTIKFDSASDSTSVRGHRLILAFKSTLLMDKLKENWSVGRGHIIADFPYDIELPPNLGSGPFATTLKYIYTRAIVIRESNAVPLYRLSRYLGFPALASVTNLHILNHVTEANSLVYLSGAENPLSAEVIKSALNTIGRNFSRITASKVFLECSLSALKSIMAYDGLEIGGEIDVFEAAVRWLESGPKERRSHSLEVLKLVRFVSMTDQELLYCYGMGQKLFRDKGTLNLLVEAYWNMAGSAIPETNNMITSSGHTMYLGLHAQPLTKKQRRLMDKNQGSLLSVMKGVKIAVTECKQQFKDDKWNCPTFDARHGKAIFGKILLKACKETAYIYAITSAGVTQEVARACSKGSIDTCGCDSWHPNHQHIQSKHLSQANNPQPTYDSREGGGLSFTNDRHLENGLIDNGGNNYEDGYYTGDNKEIIATGPNWKWGGCSDNIKFGRRFSRKFVNSAERGHDLRYIVNSHNNGAGRAAVVRSMAKVCKCQGLSGSCNLKTCWMRVAPFREIGKLLKLRYDEASKVASNNNLVPEQRDTTSSRNNEKVDYVPSQDLEYNRGDNQYSEMSNGNLVRESRDNRYGKDRPQDQNRHRKFNYFSADDNIIHNNDRYTYNSDESLVPIRRSLQNTLLLGSENDDGSSDKYRRITKDDRTIRNDVNYVSLLRRGRKNKKHLQQNKKRVPPVSHSWFMPLKANEIFKLPKHTDLVYYEESPDFCEYKPAIGSRGTRNRQCILNGQGPEGCSNMCCDRGYTSRKVLMVEPCNCTFQWCCHVKCQECQTQKIISTCL